MTNRLIHKVFINIFMTYNDNKTRQEDTEKQLLWVFVVLVSV